MVGAERCIHIFSVEPGVLVSLPRIDREAAHAQARLLGCLAECGIRHAVVRPEFHDAARLGCLHDPVRERNMSVPRTVHTDPVGPPEQGIKLERPDRLQHCLCLA